MNKKKKLSGFSVFLISYSVLLVLLIAIGLKWVWGLLIDYESGLPEVTANRVVSSFSTDNWSKYLEEAPLEISEFETKEAVFARYQELLRGKNVTYRRNGGAYSATHPVYYILAEEQPFAEFSLKQIGENPHGFPVWEVDKVNFLENVITTEDITIKVPSHAVVYVNDIPVTDKLEGTTTEPIPLAKNIKEYVKTVPGYTVYSLKGLYGQPQIRVEGDNVAPMEMADEVYFYDYVSDEKILAENEELLRWLAEKYGGYLINRVSFGTLSAKLVGNAKKCLSDIPALWAYLYGETYEYEILNFKTSNGKRYAQDCFSCDLEFTLSVRYRVTRNITYDTKLSCMFVLQDGEWKLADFIMG